MKYRKPSKAFTGKRKSKSVIGEWTKASHKRLIRELQLKKEQVKERVKDQLGEKFIEFMESQGHKTIDVTPKRIPSKYDR